MTMSSDGKDRDSLEALFADARAAPSLPSDDFMARLVAQAEAAQPTPKGVADATAQPRPRLGLWPRLVALLGGTAAVAGLGTAAMAGLVIGYVQPDPLLTLADGFGVEMSGDSLDLLPGFDTLLSEDDPT
jgi:hypothetical protein